VDFWTSRLLCSGRLLARLHHYFPNDCLLNYDRERELDGQCYLVQSNGNKHYVGAKVTPQNANADGLGENGKKEVRGIGFQLPRLAIPNSY
tara:strand:+ start:341 stop:613 length:273 start_codon:yes stop_codon:yes gene_type:complete